MSPISKTTKRKRQLRRPAEVAEQDVPRLERLLPASGTFLIFAMGVASKAVRIWRAGGGQGVPPVQQEAMFERFRKGRQGSSGTGLGLPIVRRVVENAGGSVRFDAALPSTLRLSLPAAD